MGMNRYIDKIMLFILCTALYLQFCTGTYMIVPVISAVILSALMSYFDHLIFRAAAFFAFCVAAVMFPFLTFFLPLICYDMFFPGVRYTAAAGLVPLFTNAGDLSPKGLVFILLFCLLSFFLYCRTILLERNTKKYIQLRDTAKGFSMELEEKNRELLEKQDYEVNLATLNERNRIARDLHDSIGHTLSKSILQTGAMLAVCKDKNMHGMLDSLKDTLTQGMNSVRDSIHGIYDDSIDLYLETKKITDDFTFCEISLDYDMGSGPDRKTKYAFIYIIKEALSNVMKHSDASRVKVSLTEHPAIYQLIIKDNGSPKSAGEDGIGIKNMKNRVENLNGIANTGYKDGFTVFVSIPKDGTE